MTANHSSYLTLGCSYKLHNHPHSRVSHGCSSQCWRRGRNMHINTRGICVQRNLQHLSYLFRHFPWEEEIRHRRQGHETGCNQETKPPGTDPPRVFVGELDFTCNANGEMGIKSKVNGGTPVHQRDGDGWPQSPQMSASSKVVAPNLGTIGFGV